MEEVCGGASEGLQAYLVRELIQVEFDYIYILLGVSQCVDGYDIALGALLKEDLRLEIVGESSQDLLLDGWILLLARFYLRGL